MAFFTTGLLAGQATSARISGSVQNEQGKFLAGVEVTAVNVGNNATTKVYTGFVKGSFNFLSLAPGVYQVSFDLPGYRSYVAAGIRLSADQSMTLRITLERLPAAEGAAPEEEAEADAPVPADAGPLKTWQVEFSAGAFANEPGVLNRAIYGDLEASHRLPQQYYWDYAFNGLIVSSYGGRPSGMLKTLGGIQPLTARLRFFPNRWLSLAAGISWSERRMASVYSLTHDFFNGDTESLPFPEQFSVISEFPDYRMGVEMLFPHAGAQASQAMGSGVRVAEFVHAGWMFAACRLSSLKILHDGLLGLDSTQDLAMEGRGSGPALEGGFRIDVAVWRGLGIFVEAAYLLSRVTRVTGESVSSAMVQDQKTGGILSSVAEQKKGRWWKGDDFFSRPAVRPDGGPATGTPFTLDLSGPGVRAGLCFRF
jgi:hypothetical protein